MTHQKLSREINLPPYEEHGRGPVMILVPGLDGTALLFYRQVPLLSKYFHVVTFPLLNNPDCTMQTLMEELRLLIERTKEDRGDERVILCGESFGGALSLSFALAYPESVSGLVIVNSFPVIRKRFLLRLAPWLLKIMPWGAMKIVRRFTESRMHAPHTLPEDLAEFHERMRFVGRTGYIRRLQILQSYDIRDRLREIETPALLIAGSLDRLVPSVSEARFMSSQMPNATVVVLNGYGHICLINHDLNLADYVLPWAQEQMSI